MIGKLIKKLYNGFLYSLKNEDNSKMGVTCIATDKCDWRFRKEIMP